MTNPPQSEAVELRRRIRPERASLGFEEQRAAARGLTEQLLQIEQLAGRRHGGTLATYLPTDGEIDPGDAVLELRSRGWTVALPVIGADRSMRFAEWRADAALIPNRFGIDEPAPPIVEVPIELLDVVLVPCVAVDADGGRVGFGAGYYDRAFASGGTTPRNGSADATTPPRRAVLVGVVHDLQVVERIVPAPWDVPMDVIVTDTRVLVPRH